MRLSESPLRSPAYRIIGTSVDPEANHSDDGDEVDDDGRLHKRSTQFTKRNLVSHLHTLDRKEENG